MPAFSAPLQQRSHAFSLLLARYVAGELAAAQLNGLSDLLEETDASADERAAFASFYLDALTDEGEVKLPKPDELTDLLNAARA